MGGCNDEAGSPPAPCVSCSPSSVARSPASAGCCSPPPLPVAATTYTVNLFTDPDDGAGAGTTGDLRFAINNVSAGSAPDTITITATGTITLASALPSPDEERDDHGTDERGGVIVDGGCTVSERRLPSRTG